FHIAFAQCRAVVIGLCEHSDVILASSKTGNAGSWTFKAVAAAPTGSDFFPTATADSVTGNLLVGFWTTRYTAAQHAYDVVAVPVDAATGAQSTPIRVTSTSIE